MSTPATPSTPPDPTGSASVPSGLVDAVVELVGTGTVALGAYTLAELTAVDAVVDFLEVRPSDDVLAEAVRSLAARQLLVASPDGSQVQVRGDLGIALAFQQRARSVLDVRLTGTGSGEPWRVLLLPQPEGIALEIRIDGLGVHELSLHTTEDALERLTDLLPSGDPVAADRAHDPQDVLAGAGRSALLTLSHYTAEGTVETVTESEDRVLAERGGRLHLFGRDEADPTRLVALTPRGDDARDLVDSMVGGAHPRTAR